MAIPSDVFIEWRVAMDWPAWEIAAGDVLELRWGHSLVVRAPNGVTRILPLNYGGLLDLWLDEVVRDPVRVRPRPPAHRPARSRRAPRRRRPPEP